MNTTDGLSGSAIFQVNVALPPDLVATSPTRNADGSVSFSYSVENAPLPRDTTVAVYWASGTKRMGGPIDPITTTQHAVGGPYGQSTVDVNALGIRPPGATNLIVVADPDNLISEDTNKDNNVKPLDPDIVVDSVHTKDSEKLTVEYDINNADVTTAFSIGIYRSATAVFDQNQNEQLAMLKIDVGADTTVGHHKKEVGVAEGLDQGKLWPGFDPYKYVLAVADPVPSLVGLGVDSSKAHYRNYIIGAVSVGFDLGAFGQDSDPGVWVNTMAGSLRAAGYDGAIPFGWASGSFNPQDILDAGQKYLVDKVNLAIQSLGTLGDNDVIDLHLIGHSRGSVVIGLAMQELLKDTDQHLQHGYFKMTLLDPHPANLDYDLNASLKPDGPLFPQALAYYSRFEHDVHDPRVTVPGRVNEIEQFWQQNPWYLVPLGGSPVPGIEGFVINLWGLDDQSPGIVYGDRRPPVSRYENLSSVFGVGHYEVHDYYQDIITGYFAPATSFWIVAAPTVTAGTTFDVSVFALAPDGILAAGYTGNVSLFSSSPSDGLPSDYTFKPEDGGAHTFRNVRLFKAGTQMIDAVDTTDITIVGSTQVAVHAAPASHLSIIPAQPIVISGIPFDVAVFALDPYDNVDDTYQGTVHFAIPDTDPAVVWPGDYTFTSGFGGDNGIRIFSGGITLLTVGDQTMTVTDASDDTITGSVTVTVAAPPAPPPGGGAEGRPRKPTVISDSTPVQSGEHAILLDRLFVSIYEQQPWIMPVRRRYDPSANDLFHEITDVFV
jgi:hypothetical protein